MKHATIGHKRKFCSHPYIKIKTQQKLGTNSFNGCVNRVRTTQPLIPFCDSGSTHTLTKQSSLPFGVKPIITKGASITTTQGT